MLNILDPGEPQHPYRIDVYNILFLRIYTYIIYIYIEYYIDMDIRINWVPVFSRNPSSRAWINHQM